MSQPIRSTITFLLMIVASGCGGCGDREKLTLKNWDRIEVGMTKEQVEKILGPPFECGDRTGANGMPETGCLWKTPDKKKAIVVFYQDGKVVRKGKMGLDAAPSSVD